MKFKIGDRVRFTIEAAQDLLPEHISPYQTPFSPNYVYRVRWVEDDMVTVQYGKGIPVTKPGSVILSDPNGSWAFTWSEICFELAEEENPN